MPAAAQPASAPKDEDVKKAEKYANDAYTAYQNKDYANAVALYVKALELSPSADMVYNIAKIYDTKLSDRTLAINFYRRYISEPGAEPERVREANQRIAELKEAELAANEKPTATGGGEKPTAGGATGGKPEPAPSTTPAEPRETGMTGLQTTGLVVGGIGLVGIGVGAFFGLGAQSDNDTASKYCSGNECTDQKGVDAAKDAKSKATISTIGFGAGGALLVSGVILLLAGGSPSKEKPPSTAGLSLVPSAGPRTVGLTLDGRW